MSRQLPEREIFMANKYTVDLTSEKYKQRVWDNILYLSDWQFDIRKLGQWKPSGTAGGSVNWCSHSGEPLKVVGEMKCAYILQLPRSPPACIPRITLTVIQRKKCMWISTEALFVVAKSRKHPLLSFTKELDRSSMLHAYNETLCSSRM